MSKKTEYVKLTLKKKWSILISQEDARIIMYLLQEKIVHLTSGVFPDDDIYAISRVSQTEDFMFYTGVYECMQGLKNRILIQKHEACFLYNVIFDSVVGSELGNMGAIRDALHQKLISSQKPTVTTL